jgi:hypothetical protein
MGPQVFGSSLPAPQAYVDHASHSGFVKEKLVDNGSVVYIPQGHGLGYAPAEIMTRNSVRVAELDGQGAR